MPITPILFLFQLSGHVKQLTGKTGESIVEAVRTDKVSMLTMGTCSMFQLSGHVKQLTGKTGEAIVEAVRTEEASMLIMGTRGMGKVRRTFLGSISDYCLHHSPLPVLICRHKEPKT